MKNKILLAVGVLAIFAGCSKQPQLDVEAEQNKTVKQEQNKTQPQQTEQTKEENTSIANTNLQETNLVDNTATIEVESNNTMTQEVNQNLAALLSKEVVHFDFDKYNIRPDQMPIVKRVADLLKDAKGNFTVRIEGNCDEWGSDEYNYALGLKRAKTVKQTLIDLGVPAERLTIISYGESNPVCTAHARWCWAKNRRDNFTSLP
jgi:peptidoglycan-associated lipoprotein